MARWLRSQLRLEGRFKPSRGWLARRLRRLDRVVANGRNRPKAAGRCSNRRSFETGLTGARSPFRSGRSGRRPSSLAATLSLFDRSPKSAELSRSLGRWCADRLRRDRKRASLHRATTFEATRSLVAVEHAEYMPAIRI